jgi:hypothetical protein
LGGFTLGMSFAPLFGKAPAIELHSATVLLGQQAVLQ